MKNELVRKEWLEAVQAGEQALSSLEMAGNRLGSARNWGLFDMFGGGFISDMMKHSRLNDAVRLMETAKRDLMIFQRELKDITVPMDFRLEIGNFLSFADFFFDGIVADYLVQSRINEAREQVESAKMQVSHILSELKSME